MSQVLPGLHPRRVSECVSLLKPAIRKWHKVKENDPAITVMTDLRVVVPFKIESSASLDEVNNKMIACGVRFLFVHDQTEKLVGVIRAVDILGEKPLQYMQSHGGSREDIEAGDIMIPLSRIEAIPYDEVLNAKVAEVVDALKDCTCQHMLVLEHKDDGCTVRGLFSSTQVGRQLGFKINLNQRAHTFAELSSALGQ